MGKNLRNTLAKYPPRLVQPDPMKTPIGERVAMARYRARLSRREVAERAGIHEKTVTSIERGLNIPRGQTVYALAEALGLDAEELLGLVEEAV